MFKMKFKFIYIAFFTSLLFLFANGRDTNQKAAENYHNNDYEVHFVVHKTKKAKKENFLKRKMKRIQKKVNKLAEKYDKVENNKAGKRILIILLALLFLFFLDILLLQYIFGASVGLGTVFFLFLSLILFIILIIPDKKKKKQQHKG